MPSRLILNLTNDCICLYRCSVGNNKRQSTKPFPKQRFAYNVNKHSNRKFSTERT